MGQMLPAVSSVLMMSVLGTAEAVDVVLTRSWEDYEKELGEANEAAENAKRARREKVVLVRNLRPRKWRSSLLIGGANSSVGFFNAGM